MRNKANRTEVIQTMVTPTMRANLERNANNLGLSISSYTELLIGQALSKKASATLIDEQVI